MQKSAHLRKFFQDPKRVWPPELGLNPFEPLNRSALFKISLSEAIKVYIKFSEENKSDMFLEKIKTNVPSNRKALSGSCSVSKNYPILGPRGKFVC